MKLWLIRHGETMATAERRYCGHGDPPLAERGRAQARQLAALLPRALPVWSSDLARARETAELACGITARISPAFRELNFGAFEGLTAKECEARWPEAYAGFVARPHLSAPPGGEDLSALARRVRGGLAELRAESDGSDVALITHAGPIKVLLLDALGLPLSAVYVLHVEPGSASLLELWRDSATLRALNLPGAVR